MQNQYTGLSVPAGYCPDCHQPLLAADERDRLKRERDEAQADLKLNASMLAKQCDLAREAEITAMQAQAQCEQHIRTILSCRPGESVVEAAKRWRETMQWYGNQNNYYSTTGKLPRITEDAGQRARELIGGEK